MTNTFTKLRSLPVLSCAVTHKPLTPMEPNARDRFQNSTANALPLVVTTSPRLTAARVVFHKALEAVLALIHIDTATRLSVIFPVASTSR